VVSTPFTDQGIVDFESLATLLAFLEKYRLPALTIFGLGSEAQSLSSEEWVTVGDFIAAHVTRPLIGGLNDPSLEVSLERARLYQKIGVAALMIFPPYGLATESELQTYISTLSETARCDVILQLPLDMDAYGLTWESVGRIAASTRAIRYVKVEAQPALAAVNQARAVLPDDVRVSVGFGGKGMDELDGVDLAGVQGGDAWPDLSERLWEARRSGRTATIYHLGRELFDLGDSVAEAVATNKLMLRIRGVIASERCRTYSIPLTSEKGKAIEDKVRTCAARLGISPYADVS
jgi:4-hydroxy-tetrahydrodipicolinate synthase